MRLHYIFNIKTNRPGNLEDPLNYKYVIDSGMRDSIKKFRYLIRGFCVTALVYIFFILSTMSSELWLNLFFIFVNLKYSGE